MTETQEIMVRTFHGYRPEIICLVGSTRFPEHFKLVTKILTKRGAIVLAPGVWPHSGDTVLPSEKTQLDILHKRKIDLADGVVVVDAGGYIGDSTRAEIEYANRASKPVILMSQSDLADEVTSNLPEWIR